MTKELQDLVWTSLPVSYKAEVLNEYENIDALDAEQLAIAATYEKLFGFKNLAVIYDGGNLVEHILEMAKQRINTLPKAVHVTREQYGEPEYDIDYDNDGVAVFERKVTVDECGVDISYIQRHNGEIYEYCSQYVAYDCDNARGRATIGMALKQCIDKTNEFFNEHPQEWLRIEM